ncbi:MAG TPA: LptA/OstA family protein [bacterium]|nr:LptA/OstA family protein [bacterium]
MKRIDNGSGRALRFGWCAVAALALVVTAAPAWGTSPRYAQASPPPGTSPRYAQASPAPAEEPKGPPAPVDVTGAERIEYDAATQSYTFVGAHVVVTRGDQKLESSEIHYDGANRRAVMPRHGTLSSPTMGMEAGAITADLGTRHFLAEGDVHGKFLDQGVWATVTAARVEADDRPDLRRVDASGDAVVIRGDQQLSGSRIIYDRTAQHGTVEGRAVAVRGGDRLEADHIEGSLATNDGEATGHVVLDRPATHMHGTADRATYAGRTDTVVLIGHAVVTRDRDSLAGDRVTVNLRTNHAVADGHPKIVAYPSETSP